MKIFATFHQILDIVELREIYSDELKELALCGRQQIVGQHFEQIAKVVATAG